MLAKVQKYFYITPLFPDFFFTIGFFLHNYLAEQDILCTFAAVIALCSY